MGRAAIREGKGGDRMRRLVRFALVGALALGVLGPATATAHPTKFRATLSGAEEVPPVTTQATGTASFKVSADGTELRFRLVVANITDVVQAHIHLGPVGVNAPVVAFLLHPGEAPPGLFNGELAKGTITAADLVGPLAGHPLADLLDAMEDGNTYANVHTVVNPGGEIRGQIS